MKIYTERPKESQCRQMVKLPKFDERSNWMVGWLGQKSTSRFQTQDQR